MVSSLNNCRTISVQLSANPYPIVIGEGSLGQLGQQVAAQGLKPGTKVLVVTSVASLTLQSRWEQIQYFTFSVCLLK